MFRPVIKEGDCSNCRACQRICPKEVFGSKEEETIAVCNPIRCTGCESCTAVCPIGAIKVEEM